MWRKIKILILYIHNETEHATNKHQKLHLRPDHKTPQLRLQHGGRGGTLGKGTGKGISTEGKEAASALIFVEISMLFF